MITITMHACTFCTFTDFNDEQASRQKHITQTRCSLSLPRGQVLLQTRKENEALKTLMHCSAKFQTPPNAVDLL